MVVIYSISTVLYSEIKYRQFNRRPGFFRKFSGEGVECCRESNPRWWSWDPTHLPVPQPQNYSWTPHKYRIQKEPQQAKYIYVRDFTLTHVNKGTVYVIFLRRV